MCFPEEVGFSFLAFLSSPALSPPVSPPLMKHLDRGKETMHNHPKVTPNKHSQSFQLLLWLRMKSTASSLQGLTDRGAFPLGYY